jgi:iron complex transport system ATP-binding protein
LAAFEEEYLTADDTECRDRSQFYLCLAAVRKRIMFSSQHITVCIGEKKILDDVSLEINAGEVIALVGANGAGKSTLLKAMCSDVKCAGGEIRLDDRRLSDWNHQELARKRSVLSQNTTLNFPFTAREVALLGRNPHVRRRESYRDWEIVDEALASVEAAHLAEQSFPTLSGGEQQRVHMARILAQIWDQPKTGAARYLLLDEPVSNLDLTHQHLTLQVARRFSRESTGVLIVLHDLNLAANYADRICLMKNGRIIESGTPTETLTTANIKTIFNFDVSILEYGGLPLIVPRIGEPIKAIGVGQKN